MLQILFLLTYLQVTFSIVICVIIIVFVSFCFGSPKIKDGQPQAVAKCGHPTSLKGSVYKRDSLKCLYNIELAPSPDWCLDCIQKAIIICPICGGPIFPNEPVSFYSPPDEDHIILKGVVTVSNEPLILISCAHCVISAVDYRGRWVMPGKVEFWKSALEIAWESGRAAMISTSVHGRKIEIVK